MRTSLLLAFVVSFIAPHAARAQDQALILLARTYKGHMFRADPTKETIERLRTEVPASMAVARDFIIETTTTKNKLQSADFMRIPEEETLRQIHAIRMLDLDMREEQRIGDQPLLDSLRKARVDRHALVRNYYHMLFTAVGNKNQPFDLSKLDLRPDDLGLQDETEKGIVFLECMVLCRSVIWGYINIAKPPNGKKAMENIKRYPKVNGAVYYRFPDLLFPDFDFVYDEKQQSYKGVMVDQYLELLIYHMQVLQDLGAKDEAVQDLLLSSALRMENLYKYSKNKDVLERLFTTVPTDR